MDTPPKLWSCFSKEVLFSDPEGWENANDQIGRQIKKRSHVTWICSAWAWLQLRKQLRLGLPATALRPVEKLAQCCPHTVSRPQESFSTSRLSNYPQCALLFGARPAPANHIYWQWWLALRRSIGCCTEAFLKWSLLKMQPSDCDQFTWFDRFMNVIAFLAHLSQLCPAGTPRFRTGTCCMRGQEELIF